MMIRSLLRPTIKGRVIGTHLTDRTTIERAKGRGRGRSHQSNRASSSSSSLIKQLSQNLPCFRFKKQQHINVLTKPREFYRSLLSMIRRARRRIFIASLYIGKDETELIQTISNSLREHSGLEVTILLDYLRSTREYPRDCSVLLLNQLKSSYPHRVHIQLFHTPQLNGIAKSIVPRRFDEGWGLQHMKIYGADDEVIISGANLSQDYFTNRQDRYLKLTECDNSLVDYLAELCQITGSISYQLSESSSDSIPKMIWPESNPICRPDRSRSSSKEFKLIGNELYQSFIQRWIKQTSSEIKDDNGRDDVLIFPFIQMGSFEITQETSLVVPLLIDFVERSKLQLNWTSGYFSLLREYKQKLLESNLDVKIITASPEANGFYKSKGISKFIPDAYCYLENMFYEDIKKCEKDDRIKICEWKRSGWTYHAKGLWITDNEKQICKMSTIGSSNYGRRSALRDLEFNLMILNDDQKTDLICKSFYDELNYLNRFTFDRISYEISIGVKLSTKLIRNML